MIYCKITKGKNVIINTRKNTRKKLVEGGKILKNSIKNIGRMANNRNNFSGSNINSIGKY